MSLHANASRCARCCLSVPRSPKKRSRSAWRHSPILSRPCNQRRFPRYQRPLDIATRLGVPELLLQEHGYFSPLPSKRLLIVPLTRKRDCRKNVLLHRDSWGRIKQQRALDQGAGHLERCLRCTRLASRVNRGLKKKKGAHRWCKEGAN